MRLLTPQESQTRKQVEQHREVLRSQEYEAEADRIRKKLAQAEIDFREALLRHREEWAKEELNHSRMVNAMQSEVKILERRKEHALEPITALNEAAEARLKEANEYKAQLEAKIEENEQVSELLQDKLDLVGEREQAQNEAENHLKSREDGVKIQELSVKAQSDRLTEHMTSFYAEKSRIEKEQKNIRDELLMEKQSLIAKENLLKKTEEALTNWELKLKDREGIVERIVERAKSKNIPL